MSHENVRKLVAVLAMTAVSAVAGYATADFTGPGEGIYKSKHDMNAYMQQFGGNEDPQGRLCAFCHTPHHAIDPNDADYLPLWSHELEQGTFEPYWSQTLNANVEDPLIGPSRLCMSCHDGAIAIDTHYNLTGNKILNGDDYGQYAVGENNSLSNDHPVGFKYADAQTKDTQAGDTLAAGIRTADKRFYKTGLPTTYQGSNAPAGDGNTIQSVLWNGYMTCATCHDVHNRDNAANTKDSSVNYFVYAPQDNSALCLSCHDK